MSWRTDIPGGRERIKRAPERIRQLKSDIKDTFGFEHIFDGTSLAHILPVTDTDISNQGGIYYDKTNQRIIRKENDIKTVVAENFKGAEMFFVQAAAPLGWTQITDAAINDRIMRVAGTGVSDFGDPANWAINSNSFANNHSHSLSTDVGSMTLVGETIKTVSLHMLRDGSRLPYGQGDLHWYGRFASDFFYAFHSHGNVSGTTNNKDYVHYHNLSVVADGAWRPSYVDAILASKD